MSQTCAGGEDSSSGDVLRSSVHLVQQVWRQTEHEGREDPGEEVGYSGLGLGGHLRVRPSS